ncbi:hypothetical protein EVAR_14235_1 [Eumeta japonica]|uniref:Uncharacterized protein n=1 Tax=Eumeta variegata TaxID=151549 RepID=A0A4C1WC22_EUMVA|nr:hypothetical protein EVAR_14235_1 [Eumeta japonica]
MQAAGDDFFVHHLTYKQKHFLILGKKSKTSSSATTVAPVLTAATPEMPAVIPSVKATSYTTSWRTAGKTNSYDTLASSKAKASKAANLS